MATTCTLGLIGIFVNITCFLICFHPLWLEAIFRPVAFHLQIWFTLNCLVWVAEGVHVGDKRIIVVNGVLVALTQAQMVLNLIYWKKKRGEKEEEEEEEKQAAMKKKKKKKVVEVNQEKVKKTEEEEAAANKVENENKEEEDNCPV